MKKSPQNLDKVVFRSFEILRAEIGEIPLIQLYSMENITTESL